MGRCPKSVPTDRKGPAELERGAKAALRALERAERTPTPLTEDQAKALENEVSAPSRPNGHGRPRNCGEPKRTGSLSVNVSTRRRGRSGCGLPSVRCSPSRATGSGSTACTRATGRNWVDKIALLEGHETADDHDAVTTEMRERMDSMFGGIGF